MGTIFSIHSRPPTPLYLTFHTHGRGRRDRGADDRGDRFSRRRLPCFHRIGSRIQTPLCVVRKTRITTRGSRNGNRERHSVTACYTRLLSKRRRITRVSLAIHLRRSTATSGS